VAHRDELVDKLRQLFLARDSAEWVAALTARGVPAGPICDIGDIFTDPYAQERELLRTLEHPAAGTVPTVANPVHFSRTPVSYRNAPPTLGQHTADILQAELSLTADEIARLHEDGAI
jgi:crotonobetainyl-CoA:carnitine CoA-transferase CaiB-like acyl-CoA transferase